MLHPEVSWKLMHLLQREVTLELTFNLTLKSESASRVRNSRTLDSKQYNLL
jgi:hypothetical protein